MEQFIKAGQFKAKCLKIMDQINKTKKTITITKRNVPIVKMIPIEEEEISLFGCMKGTVHTKRNIIDPIDEKWNACN